MKRAVLLLASATLLAGSAALAQDYRRDVPPREVAPYERPREVAPPAYERPHVWVRGERVPAELRDRDHIVWDWRAAHLRRPPSGYVWVRDRDRFMLVGKRTGRIAELAQVR